MDNMLFFSIFLFSYASGCRIDQVVFLSNVAFFLGNNILLIVTSALLLLTTIVSWNYSFQEICIFSFGTNSLSFLFSVSVYYRINGVK